MGCGDFSLQTVVKLEPIDEWRTGGEPPQTVHMVDVTPTFCATLQDGEIQECSVEPYGAHVGRVTLRNDAPANPTNPLEGQEVITGWRLQLISDNADAPELRNQSARVRQVIMPQSQVTFYVPLVDIATKVDFVAARPRTAMRYSAVIVLDTEQGQRLRTSSFVELGSVVNCASGTIPVSSCF